MSQNQVHFWKALLEVSTDPDERIRLWNGYLGWKLPSRVLDTASPKTQWPDLRIDPPGGGWPQLSTGDKTRLERMAEASHGHPDFGCHHYMDFSGLQFRDDVALDGLMLVRCSFKNAIVEKELRAGEGTRFFDQCYFDGAWFQGGVHFYRTQCCGPVYFPRARFDGFAGFLSVRFEGGACFAESIFGPGTKFDDSQFEERYYSEGITVLELADFRGAEFKGHTSFKNVTFGKDDEAYKVKSWPHGGPISERPIQGAN